jgi:hypothetical protein
MATRRVEDEHGAEEDAPLAPLARDRREALSGSPGKDGMNRGLPRSARETRAN